jgi:hypothetical protein
VYRPGEPRCGSDESATPWVRHGLAEALPPEPREPSLASSQPSGLTRLSSERRLGELIVVVGEALDFGAEGTESDGFGRAAGSRRRVGSMPDRCQW